jgi:hypothetical protein
MPRRKVASAYTTQIGGVNSVPVTGTTYTPPPPPVQGTPTTTVNGQVAPWLRVSPVPLAPSSTVVDRRPAIAFGVILVLLAVGSLVGAWRQAQPRSAPVAAYAPPALQAEVTAQPAPVPDWAVWMACPKPVHLPYTSAQAMAAAIGAAAAEGVRCYSYPYRTHEEDVRWQREHP